jgi:uncharacterized cupredoxin-like copper-binding protein
MRFASTVVPMCALATISGGGQAQAQSVSGEPIVIEVTMADFSFSPAVLQIPADRPVTLVFANTGLVEHEFMVGRRAVNGNFDVDLFENITVEMASEAVADHDDADTAPHDHPAAEAQDDHGTMVLTGPGMQSSMTFMLPGDLRGEWEMACFIPGHYDGGMHGTVIVN